MADTCFFAAVFAVPVGMIVIATRRAMRHMDEALAEAEREIN